MNTRKLILGAAVPFLLTAGPASAAFVLGDSNAGGVGYYGYVTLGLNDSDSFSTHVGAWSWEDDSLFNAGAGDPPVGWTHTSRWLAFELTDATLVTLTMARDASVPWPDLSDPGRLADTSSMFPSFSLYSGWDNDDGDSHTYNNRGNVAWAEDLTYMLHMDNSTLESITQSFQLPAGLYTFALGSNAAADNPNRQGFSATLSTAPEPSRMVLLGLAGCWMLGQRRRLK